MYSLEFLKQFFAAPVEIGALTPSGRALASLVTETVHVPSASCVVEFGPGTGAITEVIIDRLRPGATFFAVEINPDFVRLLRERFPRVPIYQDSAANTRTYLDQHGLRHCDAIVSGLPWANFESDLQDDLLGAVHDVLRPGGVFATYAYLQSMPLPRAVRFRTKIRKIFARVGVTGVVWRNLPPARVIWAEK